MKNNSINLNNFNSNFKSLSMRNKVKNIFLFAVIVVISMISTSCEPNGITDITVTDDTYITEVTINQGDTIIYVNNYGDKVTFRYLTEDDSECDNLGGVLIITEDLSTGEKDSVSVCNGEGGIDGEDGNNGEDGIGFVFEIEEVTYLHNGQQISLTYIHFYYDNDGNGELNKDEDTHYKTLVITTSKNLERSKTIYHYDTSGKYIAHTYFRYIDVNDDGDYTVDIDILIGEPITVSKTRYIIEETTTNEDCNGTLILVSSIEFNGQEDDTTLIYSNCKEENPDYDQLTDTVKVDGCYYIYSWIEKDFIEGFTSGDEETFSILISCQESEVICTKYFEQKSWNFNSSRNDEDFILQDGYKMKWGLLLGMFDGYETSGFTLPEFTQIFEASTNVRMIELNYGSKKDHTFKIIVIKNDNSEVLLEEVKVEGKNSFYKMDPNKYNHFVRFYDFDDERTKNIKAIKIEVVKDERYCGSHSDMLSFDNITISAWYEVCEE